MADGGAGRQTYWKSPALSAFLAEALEVFERIFNARRYLAGLTIVQQNAHCAMLSSGKCHTRAVQ